MLRFDDQILQAQHRMPSENHMGVLRIIDIKVSNATHRAALPHRVQESESRKQVLAQRERIKP